MKELKDKEVSRRTFLDYVVRATAAFITVAVGLPLIGYLISPAMARAKKEEWVQLGTAEDFKAGEPRPVKFSSFVKDGWMDPKSAIEDGNSRREGLGRVCRPARSCLGAMISGAGPSRRLVGPR